MRRLVRPLIAVTLIMSSATCVLAQSDDAGDEAVLVAGTDDGQENASNPLASVSNTDLRIQGFDLDEAKRTDYWADGAYMLGPKLKFKYELHF